jgi:hypothetical protein
MNENLTVFTLLSVNKWFVDKHGKFAITIRNKINEFKNEHEIEDILNLFEKYIFGVEDILKDGKIIINENKQNNMIFDYQPKKVRRVRTVTI